MSYLKPLVIFQFYYMDEDEKMEMLINYQQMLTNENDNSLAAREKWLIAQLEKSNHATLEPGDEKVLTYAISFIKDSRNTIDELKLVLDQI